MVSRARKNPFTEWWWTVDRTMLGLLIVLMGIGMVLSLAASPPVAERLPNVSSYHFVYKHALFLPMAFIIMIGLSFLDRRTIRRLALLILAGSLVFMVVILFIGNTINGGRRWMSVFGMSLQPAEFLKPAFVVLCAWFFSENTRNSEIPGRLFAFLLLAVCVVLLVAQPDFGQTALLFLVWGAIFFMAGMPWLWIGGFGGVAMAGLGLAYVFIPHVTSRIDRFVKEEGDNFQVDRAIESIVGGSWLGQGPGEGVVKRILPDSHTDFVFAVAAEEYGIVLCLIILGLYGTVVLKSLILSQTIKDAFTRLAISGLAILFGLQAIINMAVTVRLMPAKGMTLPFISYGGSSTLAIAIGMGFLLALSRKTAEESSRLKHIRPYGQERV
ncbi:MAG: cell division protein FtsW [Cohaesibacteraceae bacterium]|nr:cell division protein FtsW [Cohaesibacteraceae bacterium]MBL4875729.1 cell division protein FtsW [Cohaesibacteraceae bacterium]